jgi:hypothetical protein
MADPPTDTVSPTPGADASPGRGAALPDTAPADHRFHLSNLRRWAPGAGTVTIASVVLAVVIYAGYLLWERSDWAPETEGTIFVETPQVYTRERLVNDRFVQESWLRNELEGRPTIGPSETANVTRQQTTSLRVAAGGAEAPPPTPPDRGGPNADPTSSGRAPSVSPSVDFLLRNAHRELVRAHLIENQLDDRHDIRGTTIYMLKFDASVLPGNNTRKGAFVRVRAVQDGASSGTRTASAVLKQYLQLRSDEEPGSHPALADDFTLYNDWRRSLRDRFNLQFSEILRRFNANEFRYAEYYDLTASIDRPTNSQDLFFSLTNALAKLQTEREILARGSRNERFLGELDYRFHFAAKYILFLATAGNSEPSFEQLSQLLNGKGDTALVKNLDLVPLQMELLKYAVRRFGRVVIGDNSLLLGRLLQQPPGGTYQALAVAQSKTLDPFVAIRLGQQITGDHEAFEIDVDERQLSMVAFDSAEVDTIYRNENKCVGRDGQDLQQAFEEQYSLVTQYKDAGRDVRIFYSRPGEGHPNPSSLIPAAVLTPENLKLAFGASPEAPAPAPFDTCLKFAKQRPLHVGWLNFMAGILDMQTYTYATFPRYDALISESSFDASRADALSVDLQAAKTSAGMSNALRQIVRMADAKPSVVGFSGFCSQQITRRRQASGTAQQPGFCSNTPGTDDLNFGWALYPPAQAGSRYGEAISYRPMPPTQRSLSALVTVPSFWKRVKLELDTGWINDNGSFTVGNIYTYSVTLPLDYEALDTILVGPARRDSQRPSIAIERLPDSIEVEACQRAEILIPGRRLWRSTVVVLGGQRANEVVVLPDMRGIIATFYKIAARGGTEDVKTAPAAGAQDARTGSAAASEETVTERELQVWTSEGVAPPLSVLIRGLVGPCPGGAAADSNPVGTAR